MNIQRYCNIYSRFHGSFTYDVHDENTIVIPFADIQWVKSMFLKVMDFIKVHIPKKRPLVTALKCHFRTEAITSVFETDDSWSLLIGNSRLVFPASNGQCKLYATPHFVREPRELEKYLEGAHSPCENIYLYRNAIYYLDKYDIPFPGGNYFKEVPLEEDLYRLCILSVEVPDLVCWRNRRGIQTLPFATKCAMARPSPFLDRLVSVGNFNFPDSHAKSTSVIHKRRTLNHCDFLLQDILDTFASRRGTVDNVGLFIEYPFRIGYDVTSCPSSNRKFVALSVNGNQPKRVLHIRHPYERYFEYDYVPETLWTPLYYEQKAVSRENLDRVIVDSTVIGFRYKEKGFLCLTHPMLSTSPIWENVNTECILTPVRSFGDDLTVVDSYRHDATHSIHRVKHKEFDHDLWCVSDDSKGGEEERYAKRVNPPGLVRIWLDFFTKHRESSKYNYGNLNLVKLAILFARHKICYEMRIASKPNVVFEGDKDVVFYLDEKILEFINGVRLDLDDESQVKKFEEANEELCCIQ